MQRSKGSKIRQGELDFLPVQHTILSPDFNLKRRIRIRVMARAKLIIFNQLMHN